MDIWIEVKDNVNNTEHDYRHTSSVMGHPKFQGVSDEQFHDQWICRGGLQDWPPRSQDLTPVHFHAENYMKNKG
jgi:hypothetical protein